VDPGLPISKRQIRCTIKKGSAVEPWPYTRVGNFGSANQALHRTADAACELTSVVAVVE